MKKKQYNKIIFTVFFVIAVILCSSAPILVPEILNSRKEQSKKAEEEVKEEERRGGVALHREASEDKVVCEEGIYLKDVVYYSYNEQGKCVAKDRYDSEGKLSKYEHFAYDERGNCVREQSETSTSGKGGYREVRRQYDDSDRLLLEQHYEGEVLTEEKYYQYQPDKKIMVIVQGYGREGQRENYASYAFHENGKPICEYHYDKDGKVTSCWKYRYNEEGEEIYFICYNKGDESTKPLREVTTEYEEGQRVRISYEPLGHINSVDYVNYDETSRTERYYLAGYSEGQNGIHILGEPNPKWNRTLKFWEGLWQIYDGEEEIESLNCSYDRLKSYYAYWYEGGQKTWELSCEVDGGVCVTNLKHYVYDAEERLSELYRYGVTGDVLERKLQDGTWIRLEYEWENWCVLSRLLHTDEKGEVLRELTFDTEKHGSLKDWYEPLKEQMWEEALVPKGDGFVPAGEENGDGSGDGSGGQSGEEGNGNGDGSGGQSGEEGNGNGDGSSDREKEQVELPCNYVVAKGDSLWKIAKRIYGDGYQFIKIYRENKELIGPDWNFVPEGMVLYLPE